MEKGYWLGYSYMGWINGQYKEFVSEDEYLEAVRESE